MSTTRISRSDGKARTRSGILEAAHLKSASMIAMATHGRSGVREALHGSVAAAVLRTGALPVLLIRPT